MEKKQCTKCGETKELTDFSKNAQGKQGRHSQCNVCRKAKSKVWYQKNNKRHLQNSKNWYAENKDRKSETVRTYQKTDKYKAKAAEYQRRRKDEDPAYRLRCNISCHIHYVLTKAGGTKETPSFEILPYSPQELKEHLEAQFDQHMSWDNYGSYWEVDHIYPTSKLPHDSVYHPNFEKCWALDNLRPLEKSENRKKSNKVLLETT